MVMKINNKILSIPPHISTSWKNVRAIHTRGNIVIVHLNDGETIHIPGLSPEIIQNIFAAHASYIEEDALTSKADPVNPSAEPGKINNPFAQAFSNMEQGGEFPFRLGIANMEGMGAALQHNSSQKDMPDLPLPILQKIAAIAKIVSPEDIQSLPKPEPHCNCMHCQIARAIIQEIQPSTHEVEDDVSDAELSFQQWEINPSGDKLFTVINRLDPKERYSVYLGHPLGCTCGNSNCEHIIAVLKS